MKLSVIIPTCDRPERLRECLQRVLAQASEHHEVIVSDDGHASDRPVIANGLRWFQGPRRGPAANRNHGARHATGEWLVFLDDDCRPEAGWLAAFEAAASGEADVLEGRTECLLDDQFAFNEIIENPTGGALWSCNLAVRRKRFEELGGFDEDFTQPCAEDMEFASRARKCGVQSEFVEKAMVTHPPRQMTMRDLVRRTAAHRWILLYRLKTGQRPALACSAVRAVVELVVREYIDTMRMTFHLRRGRRIKGRTLEVLWRWLSLTAFLPYYAYWELRYRRMLRRRMADEPLHSR